MDKQYADSIRNEVGKKNSGGIAEKWTIHVGEFPVNQLFIYHMGKWIEGNLFRINSIDTQIRMGHVRKGIFRETA